ncbi:18376_t:CDS:2, partial [Racocetra persica]
YKYLKYDNFEDKHNRRTDILIYELYVIIDGDIQYQQCLANIRARRMMLAEREVRQRKIKAQVLANTVLEVNIDECYWTQQQEKQQQSTIEELRYYIQKIIQNLKDLDINRLQIVHN